MGLHFGAVVINSPLTGLSFYEALAEHHVAHYAVWDEGGHGSSDPVLGGAWWDGGWDPIFDDFTWVRSDLAHPAFTASSISDDPGDGALGRSLRWESGGIVDTLEEFSVPLFVLDGEGEGAPMDGYPTAGDQLDGELPVLVDVTPRRLQAFQARPGELIAWSFGDASGTVTADDVGSITVPQLALQPTPSVLRLWRE